MCVMDTIETISHFLSGQSKSVTVSRAILRKSREEIERLSDEVDALRHENWILESRVHLLEYKYNEW